MFKKYAMAIALLAPCVAYCADAVDMSCRLSTKDFFAPLIQGRLINPKPVAVENTGSINHFKVSAFKRLTAFGMPVLAVYGYADDPLLFVKSGEPQGNFYGVKVKETIANVQAQLTSVGVSNARTYRADAATTIIMCKEEI